MLDTKLYTLLKVAEYRNYTQAARSLNLTQPAVSQHIHALEHELLVARVHVTVLGHVLLGRTEDGDAVLCHGWSSLEVCMIFVLAAS